MSKTNTSLDELSLPRACLHLKSTVITPVTSNNCRVSLLLMEVQFLLKDARSSNCCHDCGRQVFVFWGLGKKQQEQLRETVPSSLLLPPGLNPQLWLQEEMNHYFPFVIRQRMLTHSPLTAAGPRQVREEAWGHCPSTARRGRGQRWAFQGEENH